ncbi:MAG: hypothetical protein C4523_01410 [Myxococcales bacterium]|nr:MAG: hypothetical protein C4523_01410 [Myxococcales bacterium]
MQDDNPCTVHECDPADGLCKPVFASDGVCEQPYNPCGTVECLEESLACELVPVQDGFLCADNDACNGLEICQSGVCQDGTPVSCPDCYSCDPATGDCVCDGSCASERCNNRDDTCEGQIDEGGVCTNTNVGIRVEMSWSNWASDVDLHFLRSGGVFGSPGSADANDCWHGNANPEWGQAGFAGDNPKHGGNKTNGYGENNSPETVHLAAPRAEPYRVLVFYRNTDVPVFRDTNVWVKIYLEGQLKASYSANLADEDTYWNVACIDYASGSVRRIENADDSNQIIHGSLSGIDANACSSSGAACATVCDCGPGHVCQNSQCVPGNGAAFCCEYDDCPAGSACYSRAYEASGSCGFAASFDSAPGVPSLSSGVNIERLYSPWGVTFRTSRANSRVSTDEWELDSQSQNNSAGTRDADGTRWRGDVRISFIQPQPVGGASPNPAVAPRAAFYIGQAGSDDAFRVTAYDLAGDIVFDQLIDRGNTRFVEIIDPPAPMREILIQPGSDPTFVIDDLTVPLLFWPMEKR